MPDDQEVPRLTLRGLTGAETQELAVLQALMRNGADMTAAQRRRWFELSHRHDLTRGAAPDDSHEPRCPDRVRAGRPPRVR
jgi:hypothetical protein